MTDGRFEHQVDPDLHPGLEVYRMLGFEEADFSPDNLARMRTTMAEFMTAVQAELRDNEGVTSEDRAVAGPDGNKIPVRVYWPINRNPVEALQEFIGSMAVAWIWATLTCLIRAAKPTLADLRAWWSRSTIGWPLSIPIRPRSRTAMRGWYGWRTIQRTWGSTRRGSQWLGLVRVEAWLPGSVCWRGTEVGRLFWDPFVKQRAHLGGLARAVG